MRWCLDCGWQLAWSIGPGIPCHWHCRHCGWDEPPEQCPAEWHPRWDGVDLMAAVGEQT